MYPTVFLIAKYVPNYHASLDLCNSTASTEITPKGEGLAWHSSPSLLQFNFSKRLAHCHGVEQDNGYLGLGPIGAAVQPDGARRSRSYAVRVSPPTIP